jgi:hypothetical protein
MSPPYRESVSLVNAPEGMRHCAGTDESIPQTPYQRVGRGMNWKGHQAELPKAPQLLRVGFRGIGEEDTVIGPAHR